MRSVLANIKLVHIIYNYQARSEDYIYSFPISFWLICFIPSFLGSGNINI